MSNLSIYEHLALSTIRIECESAEGRVGTGTGFFAKFCEEGESFVPAVVTNKHVIEGTVHGQLLFTLSDSKGAPMHGHLHQFKILNFEQPWVMHPDPEVDLCAMPIYTFVQEMRKKGIRPYFTFLDTSLHPSEQDIEEMSGLEKVVMIGYPNGLWDTKHNLPIFRSGVLASHYRFDWNGRPECVIDAACVPGSSGSPVMIIDTGQVFNRKGLHLGSSRIKLLGVLYGGPVLAADGSIEVVPAPTSISNIRTRTRIPINLGYVIKTRKLNDFNGLFAQRLKRGI